MVDGGGSNRETNTHEVTTRKAIPHDVETRVLIRSARRCCLCFWLETDTKEKRGQIAHLDQDPANNAEDNLVFLCLDHHRLYDSGTNQPKSYTRAEVNLARHRLYTHFEQASGGDRQTDDPGGHRTLDEKTEDAVEIAAKVLGPFEVNPSVVEVKAVRHVTVVTPKGSLSVAAEALQIALRDAVRTLIGANGRPDVVLDMTQIRYLDSSGVGLLVQLYTIIGRAGGRLKLAGATRQVDVTLKMMRLATLLELTPTVNEALSQLGVPDE